ncbi:MAG: CotH kinase family protein [Bacteroidales bacterium]|nr:CotH kinase family protein [Bacteroidales bacterium]
MVRFRHIVPLALIAILAACAPEFEETGLQNGEARIFRAELTEDGLTRTYVDAAGRMKWYGKDSIAVLKDGKSALYRFDGATGSNTGTFSMLSGNAPGEGSVTAIYPYKAFEGFGTDGTIKVSFPAVQHYEEHSFGRNAALMAAATSSALDNTLKFKCAGAFLIVKIYGEDYISRIKLTGHNSEKLSGSALLSVTAGADPAVEMTSSASAEVTLECGFVPIGATAGEATQFWIAVPPVKFEQGFELEITNGDGKTMTMSTDKPLEIKAGTAQPLVPFEASIEGGRRFISFSLSPSGSNSLYNAMDLSGDTLKVYVPWDSRDALTMWFDAGDYRVTAGDTEAESGVTTLDFTNPVTCEISSANNGSHTYLIEAVPVDFPVVFINTPGGKAITSRIEWTYDVEIFTQDTDGRVKAYTARGDQNLGNGLKGRGNSSWGFVKKPYAIKLGKKADMLGIMTEKGHPKGHKRWCLLAEYRDRTCIRNDVALKIASLFPGFEWTPSGRHVELVFNGEMMGVYYLCEQIKVDSGRLDIDEMKEGQISGLAGTGGYLLELDTYTNSGETVHKTSVRGLPVKMKSPDEDDWSDKTEYNYLVTYIMNHLNRVETQLARASTVSEYGTWLDEASFIDFWAMNELVGLIECVNGPRSCHMYKKRDPEEGVYGKLFAGPVWDYDCETFHRSEAYSGDKDPTWDRTAIWYLKKGDKVGIHYYRDKSQSTAALYYGYLFSDEGFRNKVIERWNTVIYPALAPVPEYIQSISAATLRSVQRNAAMWPVNITRNGDESLPVEEADALLLDSYLKRLNWLNAAINNPDFCVE